MFIPRSNAPLPVQTLPTGQLARGQPARSAPGFPLHPSPKHSTSRWDQVRRHLSVVGPAQSCLIRQQHLLGKMSAANEKQDGDFQKR